MRMYVFRLGRLPAEGPNWAPGNDMMPGLQIDAHNCFINACLCSPGCYKTLQVLILIKPEP